MSLKKFKDDIKKEAISLALERLTEVCKTPLSVGRSGTGGDNAHYGAVSLNTEGKLYLQFQQHPCHAFMKNYQRPLVVVNRFGQRPGINEDANKEYFDWITSDESPWRSFYGRNISHGADGTLVNAYAIFKSGWVWSELEKHPSNLQHSFLVASRMPAEWPAEIGLWYKFVSKGIPKALAFLFLDVFKPLPEDPGKYKINFANKYDWPVDICTSDEETVRNFSHGRVENLLKPYSECQQYRPVNRIFGPNELDSSKGYPSQVFERYRDTGMSEKDSKAYYKDKTSFAPWNHRSYWTVTEEELLTIMKLESKRLEV